MSHYVYRCFDADGGLLYIGYSINPAARVAAHRSRAFGSLIADFSVEEFATREEGLAAERAAIRAEHPRYNIKSQDWGGRARWTDQQYRDFIAGLCPTTQVNQGRIRRLTAEMQARGGAA